MPLKLTVDADRWRKHVQTFAEATPGLVPVAKGNGYGLTLRKLAHQTEWLNSLDTGVDTLAAVGTYNEV